MDIKRIKYLWEAASIWPLKNRTTNILKSYYLTTCENLVQNKEDFGKSFDEKYMCPKCSLQWCDGNFRLKSIPKLRTSKGKKLIEAYKHGKNLSKKQKNRVKWLLKRTQSYTQLTCNLCKHGTKIPSRKPKPKMETNHDFSTKVDETTTTKKKKKKQKLTNSNVIHKNKVLEISKIKNLQEPSIHIKKKKNKTVKSQQKVQSKTQQKNSLAQLAELLKQKDLNLKNNSNDRLEIFLK